MGSWEADVLRMEGKSSSLSKAMFGTDISRSEEEVNEVVKRVVGTICKRVLRLKDEIAEEMNLTDTEEKLKRHVETLNIHRRYLRSLTEELPTAPNNEIREKLMKSKDTAMGEIRKVMSVREIEERIRELNLCWEYVRRNYKDEISETIDRHIKKSKEKSKQQEEEALKWTDLLPTLDLSGQEQGSQTTCISYYE